MQHRFLLVAHTLMVISQSNDEVCFTQGTRDEDSMASSPGNGC